jgi:4-alpha-glucanotransferase
MQDLLVLGNEARMNFPGKTSGWWKWRFTARDVHTRLPGIAHGLAELTRLYGRPVVKKEMTEEEIEEMMKAARAVEA